VTRRQSTVALVESATQLLNVAEWAFASGEAADLRIDVLAPRDQETVRQIRRVGELIRELDVEVRLLPVRSRSAEAGLATARVARDVATASQLVLGDPFSRFVQTLLPMSPADHVVLVDDGTATWEFVRCIDEGRPMVRWQVPLDGAEQRATRATRLLSPGMRRRITVFSCLGGAHPVGATALANNYAWARSWRRPEIVENEVDVLGVSLVDTGVIQREDYLRAVRRLATRHGRLRYIAHRRESTGLVGEIAAMPGVRVSRNDLPVELALRQGPVARHIVAFPSTAAHTLPVVLSDLGLRIEVRPVDPAWFRPETTPHARAFVERIAHEAPLPPALEIV
jgi:hypothetical protein